MSSKNVIQIVLNDKQMEVIKNVKDKYGFKSQSKTGEFIIQDWIIRTEQEREGNKSC